MSKLYEVVISGIIEKPVAEALVSYLKRGDMPPTMNVHIREYDIPERTVGFPPRERETEQKANE